MIIGFIIWSSCALLIIGIGIWSWNSKKPAGFYAGVVPPMVKDVKSYNHAVAVMWFVYAILFELLGFSFLFQKLHLPLYHPPLNISDTPLKEQYFLCLVNSNFSSSGTFLTAF